MAKATEKQEKNNLDTSGTGESPRDGEAKGFFEQLKNASKDDIVNMIG